MPSGKTHDRITLWGLPFVGGLTYGLSRSSEITLLVSGGFLFSGLMFGPDLDIHSQQYRRWGALRWIWLPYRRSMRHRSYLSHGPVIGTIFRLIYLMGWLLALGVVVFWVGVGISYGLGKLEDWMVQTEQAVVVGQTAVGGNLSQYAGNWLALVLGLELGAMSHSLSDWLGSTYGRWKRGGPGWQRRRAAPGPPQKASAKSSNADIEACLTKAPRPTSQTESLPRRDPTSQPATPQLPPFGRSLFSRRSNHQ
jgi:uncharacterized metal-binding protein